MNVDKWTVYIHRCWSMTEVGEFIHAATSSPSNLDLGGALSLPMKVDSILPWTSYSFHSKHARWRRKFPTNVDPIGRIGLKFLYPFYQIKSPILKSRSRIDHLFCLAGMSHVWMQNKEIYFWKHEIYFWGQGQMKWIFVKEIK